VIIKEVKNVLNGTIRMVWAILKVDYYGCNDWEVTHAARKYVTIRNDDVVLEIDPYYISELIVK